MKTLVIVGAGGHGKVVADTAREMAEWDRIVFVDARYPTLTICGSWPVVEADLQLVANTFPSSDFIIAIGNNSLRLKLYDEAIKSGFKSANVIHPTAYISPDASLAQGVAVFANAVINIGAEVGKACIINTGATIDHDCFLGDGVHVSPGANLAGGVSVGARAWVGIGATVRQSTFIGSDVVVGSGSAVVKDVNDGMTVAGCPAKNLKKRPAV